MARIGLAIALTLVACQSPGARRQSSGRQRDVITRQELLDAPQGDQDLFSVIRSLRPRFFAQPPGVPRASAAPLAVYFDGRRQNGIDVLRSFRASAVEEVRYLDPTAALNEFGAMASGGALAIKLYDPSKSSRPPEGE